MQERLELNSPHAVRSPRLPGRPGPLDPIPLSSTNEGLLEYWMILKPWWRRIAVATLAGIAITFIVCKLVMTQWYQASAIIRAASQEGPVSPIATIVSPNVSSLLSSLTNSTGLGESLPSDVAEFEDVLQSYHFTTSLIRRHHLGPMLDEKSIVGWLVNQVVRSVNAVKAYISNALGYPQSPYDPSWYRYQEMQGRFDVEFDSRQGSLTLTFMDRDPDRAQAVLGFYIADLRERIRTRVVRDTAAVVASLKQEMAQTSDPLVQQQIAGILADQIQQLGMAQAEADFAFTVTEHPYVPTEVYKPKTVLFCALAAVAIPMMFFLVLTIYYRTYLPIREAERANTFRERDIFDGQLDRTGDHADIEPRQRAV
jgi:hypothetical protein